MAKSVFDFPARVTLVGVEFKSPFASFPDKNGKTVKGKPARYLLSFLFGKKNEKTGLYVRAPIVVTAETDIAVGGKINKSGEYAVVLHSNDGILSVQSITGIEIMKEKAPEEVGDLPF